MKSPLFSKMIVLLLILLIACQVQTPTAISVPTATAIIIPSLSPTATPDPEIISPENASQLVLKFMNMGNVRDFPTFSPDGKWIYQESTAGTYAFDTVSYQDIRLLTSSPIATPSPSAQVFSELELLPGYATQPDARKAISSPDTSLIAGYFHGESTGVWRLADEKLINTFEGYPIEISADNRLILIGRTISHDAYSRYYADLYELESGKQLGSWSWGGRQAFFLSNNQVVIESSDGYTRIFDPVTRKVPHAFAGWYAAFSPDEQKLAVLYGNQIFLYEVPDGKLIYKFDSGLPSTDAANLRFSGNGEILAGFTIEYYCCTGYSNQLFVWRVSDGHLLADLSQRETLGQWAQPPFALSPDGQTIVIDRRVIRVSDGSLIKDLTTYFIPPVTNLAFTSDGQKIIVLDNNGQVHLYSVESEMLSLPQDADREAYLPFLQPASGMYSEDVIEVPSPDGKFLARRNLGIVTISRISSAEESIQIPVTQVKCFTFSPDGRIIALGLRNGSVELWDPDSKQKIFTLPPRTNDDSNYVGGLAFSPDGKLLAIGMIDGTVRLYGPSAK
jgi:WD40 repeat protein